MDIDWSLRFGDLVSFVGFAGGGLSVIFMMKSDIKSLALKLGFLKETVDEQKAKIEDQSKEIVRFGELITVMGRFEERFIAMTREMERLKEDINSLRRGEGLIVKQKG